MTTDSGFRLIGSHDAKTGQVFFPPRALSVDGALRSLTHVELPPNGVLHSYAVLGDDVFGLIDLEGGVRIQCSIRGGTPELDAEYRLKGGDAEWWFERA